MVWERRVLVKGKSYIVVVSDEIQALQAAQAAGRAVVGVVEGALGNGAGGDGCGMRGVPYLVPSWEDATEELLELVMLRYLNLPWLIDETKRLVIRELVREDAFCIPRAECSEAECIFCNPDTMDLYIKNQYKFYEYGTWALIHKDTGLLIGMAGVSNPRLPDDMEVCLQSLEQQKGPRQPGGPGESQPCESTAWLELGYHIFRPWRGAGYGREAVAAVMSYSYEVLAVRLCALVHSGNLASRHLVESLGMRVVMVNCNGSGGQEAKLLYVD